VPAEEVDLEEVEKSLVVQAIERTGGSETHAAALLSARRDQIRSMRKVRLRVG